MAITESFSISRLSEFPSFAPALAEAHAREWGHLYAGWGRNAALAEFQMETGGSDLPVTWIAHHPSGSLLGSISLVLEDLPGHPGLNPWLASLFVFPAFRDRGLGRILTQTTLDFLAEHRHPHAYLFTKDKVSFFSNFQFAFHAKTQAQGHEVTLMRWANPHIT